MKRILRAEFEECYFCGSFKVWNYAEKKYVCEMCGNVKKEDLIQRRLD